MEKVEREIQCQPVFSTEANLPRYSKQRHFITKLLDGLESKRGAKEGAPQKSVTERKPLLLLSLEK